MHFQNRVSERSANYLSWISLLILDVIGIVIALATWLMFHHPIAAGLIVLLVLLFPVGNIKILQPNQAAVVTFLGQYLGTVQTSGLIWFWPGCKMQVVDLSQGTFNSPVLKVNDGAGNPVDISAVITYHVARPAQSLFNVDDYRDFIKIQSETAIRHVASLHPYDSPEKSLVTLHGNVSTITQELVKTLSGRLSGAGIVIDDARIAQLAYSDEVAGAMLMKQQSEALLAARKAIVDGAVGICEDAVHRLMNDLNLDVDDETIASMVNNLMVTIVSGRGNMPTVDTGA